MIYSTFENPYDRSIFILIWCAINFFIITYFIIYAFSSAFFEKLLQRPPLWVHIIAFVIMIVDIIWGLIDLKLSRIKKNTIDIFAKQRLKNQSAELESAMYTFEMKVNQKIDFYPRPLINKQELQISKNFQFYPWIMVFMNFLVLIIIIASYLLGQVNLNAKYVYMIALLRLPQVVLFNGILRKILQASWKLFRVYIVLKIFYMILLFAHVLGCIFYFVDSHLISIQYYGSIAENPSYYYQGYLKCYTPIYSLQEQYRYVYAMYYMIALLATVAYGDIIPKNPIQDGMVIFYLYFSTLSIAWILEQMIIVFRRNNTSFYILLRKVVFFHQALKKKNIYSFQASNYLIRNVWELERSQPLLNRLNPNMFDQILRQNNIAKFTNSFFLDYCIKWMHEQYYSEGQILSDNNLSKLYVKNNFTVNYVMEGRVRQGYTFRMFAGFVSQKKIFGLEQLIVGTPFWKKHLRIITESQCRIFTINSQKLRLLFQALYLKKKKLTHSLITQIYKQLNFAGIESTQGIFSIFPNTKNEEKMNRTIMKFSETRELYEFLERKHQFRNKILFSEAYSDKKCSVCQSISHEVIDCPQCHFIPDINSILSRKSQRQNYHKRWNFKVKKTCYKKNKLNPKDQIKLQMGNRITRGLYEHFNILREKIQMTQTQQQIYKQWNIMKQYNF